MAEAEASLDGWVDHPTASARRVEHEALVVIVLDAFHPTIRRDKASMTVSIQAA